MKNKKSLSWKLIFTILSIVVVALLIINILLKSQPNINNTLDCIGNNSILVASKGCGACHKQIEMLGEIVRINLILFIVMRINNFV